MGAALVVAMLAANCRVRKIAPEQGSEATEIAGEMIQTPGDVAPEPPSISRQHPAPPAGLVVTIGFGDVGFAGIRRAQLEAEQLLPALERQDNPWGAFATWLGDIAERRWGRDERYDKRAGLRLSEGGSASLQHRTASELLPRALSALGKHAPEVDTEDAPNADWSLLDGPLVAIARTAKGEYGVVWLEQRRSTAPARSISMAHRVGPTGALSIVCACETPALVETVAEELHAHLSSPSDLARHAADLAAELDDDAWLEGSYAMMVLTDRSLVVEGTADLVQASAGYVGGPGGSAEIASPDVASEPDAGTPPAPDAGAPRSESALAAKTPLATSDAGATSTTNATPSNSAMPMSGAAPSNSDATPNGASTRGSTTPSPNAATSEDPTSAEQLPAPHAREQTAPTAAHAAPDAPRPKQPPSPPSPKQESKP